MPLGDYLSKTITNMGHKGLKEDDDWNAYEHEVQKKESFAQPLHPIRPSGRGQHFNTPEPKTVEKNLASGKTTRKRSNKPSVSAKAEAQLQEINKQDIKKRNLKPPKSNDKNH